MRELREPSAISARTGCVYGPPRRACPTSVGGLGVRTRQGSRSQRFYQWRRVWRCQKQLRRPNIKDPHSAKTLGIFASHPKKSQQTSHHQGLSVNERDLLASHLPPTRTSRNAERSRARAEYPYYNAMENPGRGPQPDAVATHAFAQRQKHGLHHELLLCLLRRTY